MTALNLTRDLVDEEGENLAVCAFLRAYSCDCAIDLGQMRTHMKRSGWDGCWPEWAANERAEYPLTKAGAQLWIRHLFSLERAALAQSPVSAKPSTLAEQVARAQAEMATWSPEVRASVRLQGSSNMERPVSAEGLTIPLDIAQLIDNVFLPSNPNKMRTAKPEVIASAWYFKRAIAATDKRASSFAAPALVAGAPNWINAKLRPPEPGLIVKRWNSGSVWAGVYRGDAKGSSCDWWIPLSTGTFE